MSMMLASPLSSRSRCSPEKSLEQEAELALLHQRRFQGSSGPALVYSHGQSDLGLRPYLPLLRFFFFFFMGLNQKYDPTAFCSSEVAFQSKSQPLKLSPAEQRLARGWNSQAGLLLSVVLAGSVSPCSCTAAEGQKLH